MENIQKKINTKLIATPLFVFYSITAFAGEDIISDITKGFSGKNITSLYIIGGVLGIGIFGYIIVSFINKFSKKNNNPKPKQNQVSHRRNHQHNKIIKK